MGYSVISNRSSPLFIDPAAASRPSVTSPSNSNTKTVFNLEGSSACRVLTEASAFHEIQLQWADTRSLHLFIRTQRPCSNEKAPVPAVSNRPLSLFMRSSCSGQGLDRFTQSNEHKDRVQMKRLQCLPCLTAHFRFSIKSRSF